MKNIFLVLFIFVFGCQKEQSIENNSTNTQGISNKINATKKILKGDWIIKTYLDLISSQQSAFHAFENLNYQDVFGIYFNEMAFDKEELTITNMHEGVEQPFIIMEDGSIQVFYFSKNYIKEPLATLTLTRLNKDTLINYYSKIDTSNYSFIKLKRDLDIFLNSTIFSGKYKLYDQNDLFISDVIFMDSGVIKGFSEYTNYSILEDYNDDIPQCDLIYLRHENGNRNWLTWKKQNNEIMLYEFDDDFSEINYESKISKMKYKLTQQKQLTIK